MLMQLSFDIKKRGHRYSIYIERNVCLYFKSKNEAMLYVRKYKSVLQDNLRILTELNLQVHAMYMQNYEILNFDTISGFNELQKTYLHQNELIFFNRGGDEKTTVQFNKIRVCFNLIEDMNTLMIKFFSKTRKDTNILNRLYALRKMHLLVINNYNEEIKGVYGAIGYRGKIVELKPLNNDIEIETFGT